MGCSFSEPLKVRAAQHIIINWDSSGEEEIPKKLPHQIDSSILEQDAHYLTQGISDFPKPPGTIPCVAFGSMSLPLFIAPLCLEEGDMTNIILPILACSRFGYGKVLIFGSSEMINPYSFETKVILENSTRWVSGLSHPDPRILMYKLDEKFRQILSSYLSNIGFRPFHSDELSNLSRATTLITYSNCIPKSEILDFVREGGGLIVIPAPPFVQNRFSFNPLLACFGVAYPSCCSLIVGPITSSSVSTPEYSEMKKYHFRFFVSQFLELLQKDLANISPSDLDLLVTPLRYNLCEMLRGYDEESLENLMSASINFLKLSKAIDTELICPSLKDNIIITLIIDLISHLSAKALSKYDFSTPFPNLLLDQKTVTNIPENEPNEVKNPLQNSSISLDLSEPKQVEKSQELQNTSDSPHNESDDKKYIEKKQNDISEIQESNQLDSSVEKCFENEEKKEKLVLMNHKITYDSLKKNWNSTGLYLFPKTICKITIQGEIPPNLIIQIGAHTENLAEKEGPWPRWPILTVFFNVPHSTTELEISSPFGGPIYIVLDNDWQKSISFLFTNVSFYPFIEFNAKSDPQLMLQSEQSPITELKFHSIIFTLPTFLVRQYSIENLRKVAIAVDRLSRISLQVNGDSIDSIYRIVYDVDLPQSNPECGYPIVFHISQADELFNNPKPFKALFQLLIFFGGASLPEGLFEPEYEDLFPLLSTCAAFGYQWPKKSPLDFIDFSLPPIFMSLWDIYQKAPMSSFPIVMKKIREVYHENETDTHKEDSKDTQIKLDHSTQNPSNTNFRINSPNTTSNFVITQEVELSERWEYFITLLSTQTQLDCSGLRAPRQKLKKSASGIKNCSSISLKSFQLDDLGE